MGKQQPSGLNHCPQNPPQIMSDTGSSFRNPNGSETSRRAALRYYDILFDREPDSVGYNCGTSTGYIYGDHSSSSGAREARYDWLAWQLIVNNAWEFSTSRMTSTGSLGAPPTCANGWQFGTMGFMSRLVVSLTALLVAACSVVSNAPESPANLVASKTGEPCPKQDCSEYPAEVVTKDSLVSAARAWGYDPESLPSLGNGEYLLILGRIIPGECTRTPTEMTGVETGNLVVTFETSGDACAHVAIPASYVLLVEGVPPTSVATATGTPFRLLGD